MVHERKVTPLSACRPGEPATKAFVELAAVLGQAPDPQPYLDAIGPLQDRVNELQRESRRLQVHRQAAESEASSASQAVLRSRELERENADLQAQLKQKVQSAYSHSQRNRARAWRIRPSLEEFVLRSCSSTGAISLGRGREGSYMTSWFLAVRVAW